jgi:hypothetical protein
MTFNIVRGSLIAAVAAVLSLGVALPAPVQAQRVSATAVANPDLAAKGAWDAGTAYAVDDIVLARGSTWRAIKANTGRVPGSTSPNNGKYWELLARGFNPTGAWSSATQYQPDDLATSNGSTWRAKKTNTNIAPVAGNTWEQMAAAGAAGATGATGATGPAGVVARIHADTFQTSNGFNDAPLTSGAAWAQASNEVQELFRVGTVTVSNPADGTCNVGNNPPEGIQIDLKIDGRVVGPFITQTFGAPAPGQTVTSRMDLNGPPDQLAFPEPGPAGHTAVVSVGENCTGGGHLRVSFTFDVLGFR